MLQMIHLHCRQLQYLQVLLNLHFISNGVDVVASTIDNKTTIYFAPDSSGHSGSITLDGIVDADLSSININSYLDQLIRVVQIYLPVQILNLD